MSGDSMFEDIIRQHGWAVQGVFDPSDTGGPVGWAYTIGLEDRDRPEMIIVGLPTPTAHSLLNRVVEGAETGARSWPEVGDTILGLSPEGYGLRVIDVDVAAAGDRFLGALARRGNAVDFRPLQLVWQDADFSWTDGTSDRQPLLGSPWW